jgi:ElaA protein
MHEALARAEQTYPGAANRIGAQRYLERFYRTFGYETVSDPYDEDGIPHIEMLRSSSTSLKS